MSVNIVPGLSDQFYRYKMPRLQTKIEGAGNGIKTVIPNMKDVGRSLYRPPEYPTKFFGCELGAQTQLDEKNTRYIVNGAHENEKLVKLLEKFIEKFVLCKKCNNPETDVVIQSGMIRLDCKACGKLSDVDMRHKLATFILNNPPDDTGLVIIPRTAATKGSIKKSREEKKIERKLRKKGDQETNGTSTMASEDEGMGDIDLDAPPLADDDIDEAETDWADAPINNHLANQAKAVERINARLEQVDLDAGDDDAADSLDNLIEAIQKLSNPTYESVMAEAQRCGVFRGEKVLLAFGKAVFDKNISQQFTQFKGILTKLTDQNEKAQRSLIGAIEYMVGVKRPELLPKTSVILLDLYQRDLVEEDVFFKWYKKVLKKYCGSRKVAERVRAAALEFITFLETASEESGDEEEEDEEEDEEKDVSPKKPSPIEKVPVSAPSTKISQAMPIAKNTPSVGADEFDINDI